MSMNPASMMRYRIAVALVSLMAPTALALVACAESAESASDREDSSVSVPGAGDAGPDAVDGSDAGDAALPDVPCAVGNVCRVPTPLTTGPISAIGGRSRTDVWAAGSLGRVMHWDGQAWTMLGTTDAERRLTTLSSISLGADETWGVAGTHLVRRGIEPASVRSIELFGPYDTSRALTSVVALPDGAVYVGSARGGLSSNPSDRGQLFDVTSFSPSLISIIPAPTVAETGQPWPMNIRAMAFTSDTALWMVGDHGAVARYPLEARDGGERSGLGRGIVFPLALEHDLFAAWADGNHLWVAGDGGMIVHFDGAAWHIGGSGTNVALRAIFGLSATDIWAAGDGGVLLHFDGAKWSRVPIHGYSGSLRAIWGGAPDDVWIGGEDGMFHWGALP